MKTLGLSAGAPAPKLTPAHSRDTARLGLDWQYSPGAFTARSAPVALGAPRVTNCTVVPLVAPAAAPKNDGSRAASGPLVGSSNSIRRSSLSAPVTFSV
jgi:hypothetical protein